MTKEQYEAVKAAVKHSYAQPTAFELLEALLLLLLNVPVENTNEQPWSNEKKREVIQQLESIEIHYGKGARNLANELVKICRG